MYALMYALVMALPKIKSATELRKDLFNTIEEVLKGKVQIITHKKGDSVLLSKENYEELLEQIETLKDITRGLKDIAEGRVLSHEEFWKDMNAYMKKKSASRD